MVLCRLWVSMLSVWNSFCLCLCMMELRVCLKVGLLGLLSSLCSLLGSVLVLRES